jgi:acetyl-CoA acetyltransferase
MRDVVVLGAGLHRYGIYPDKPFNLMGAEACQRAFEDAGIQWPDVEIGYCGSTNIRFAPGHAIALQLGTYGATMTNVENASASGSSAFREAYLAIASGLHDVALAVGVDKLREYRRSSQKSGADVLKAPRNTGPAQAFAARAHDHMEQYGTTVDQLAMVSVKSHRNASFNPYAHFQKPVTIEEVHRARMVAEPLTVLHCCPWDEGAAAVVLCAAEVAARFTSKSCPRVLASVCTGLTGGDPLVDLTQVTAYKAYDMAGCGPEDLNLVECHDAFTIEEILYYEALGICPTGEGGKLIESGATEVGGRIPVNTSGGLISMGHPIGPTGLGQIAELLWQIRGEAGGRQVPDNPRIGLAHMVGAGGVCFIHILGL